MGQCLSLFTFMSGFILKDKKTPEVESFVMSVWEERWGEAKDYGDLFWPCFQAESDLPVRECSQVDTESLFL